MAKYLFPLALLLAAGLAHGEPATDPDGFTNLRSQKSASSQVVARVDQGEPFYTYTQDGNWWQVMTRDGKVGYMHVSRIKVVGPR